MMFSGFMDMWYSPLFWLCAYESSVLPNFKMFTLYCSIFIWRMKNNHALESTHLYCQWTLNVLTSTIGQEQFQKLSRDICEIMTRRKISCHIVAWIFINRWLNKKMLVALRKYVHVGTLCTSTCITQFPVIYSA